MTATSLDSPAGPAKGAAVRQLEAALREAEAWPTADHRGFRDAVVRDLRMALRWLRGADG